MSEIKPIPRATIYAHGSLGMPMAVYGYPLAIWLAPHYSGVIGLDLATVGLILMIARLTDVVTDPLIGELSDRWRTPFGRRKHWLIIGTPVMLLGIYKLFIPAPDVGLLYMLVWLTVFFLGSTMIALPHRAWGAELSTDYHQRSRVTAGREIYVLAGLLLAATVPLVVEVTADGGDSVVAVFGKIWTDATGAFTGEIMNAVPVDRGTLTGPVLYWLALVVIGMLPVAAAICFFMVKEPPIQAAVAKVSLKESLGHLMKNGPMVRVLIIVLLVQFGEAFRNAVSLFFIADIVGVPTIGAAYFFYFIAGLAAIPFWLFLGKKFGKHKAFMMTLITVACVSAANFLLVEGDYFVFFLLFIVKGFCFGGLQFLPLAMLADVVDVDSARTGGKRAGSYFAILGISEKLAIACGTGFSYYIVGRLGFDPALGVEGSTDLGVLTLRLVYCFGPVLFYGLAMKLIWNYPLTPARHARLRDTIARREARLQAKS
ncbi:MAG TPA: MFS transporter [Gammaproteobacteria bacterium]|nr:MFS transporter [Gammaproteobacteria bacterium]